MDVNVNLSFLYVLFCFLIIFFIARKTLFSKLDQILSERHELIEGAKEKAVGQDEQIEETLTELNAKLAQARSEAFSARQDMRSHALNEQGEIIETARNAAADKLLAAQEQLDAALDDARATLTSDSEEIARDITNRILGRTA